MTSIDRRMEPPDWSPHSPTPGEVIRFRALIVIALLATTWYFSWLLLPEHMGNPVLYGILLTAELFNVGHALGFWWTCAQNQSTPQLKRFDPDIDAEVDVFVPVYNEPIDVVEPVIAAATKLRGVRANVALLDDGNSPAMRSLAERYAACYLQRPTNRGAKAGNINDALNQTAAPYIAVLDCDHVPEERFLEATVGYFSNEDVAFVQTPQYYANAKDNPIARAAWSQQALFFGAISTGKARLGAMFCCGTNVIFRRSALDAIGGFPENSVTEDFELSIRCHNRGWKSVYVPEVLAKGLGPEDIAAYVGQQLRWSRGCISALPQVLKARLPLRLKLQYLLSASYFLYGWTVLAYMVMPVARIIFGVQPVAAASSADFVSHFAPYFILSMMTVALAGAGDYSFAAFALAATNFWIGIVSTVRAVLRRPGKFVVTPKEGGMNWQPGVVAPSLCVAAVLIGTSVWGMFSDPTPGVLNAVAFSLVHVAILLSGAAPALHFPERRGGRTAIDHIKIRKEPGMYNSGNVEECLSIEITAEASPERMPAPTVSICIPAYNEETGIYDLLIEIFAQQQQAHRLVAVTVASDGSTDATVEEANRVQDARLTVIEYQTRAGKATRINEFLSSCETDVLVLLDADIQLCDPELIDTIVRSGDVAKVGLVGVTASPLPPTSWVGRAIAESVVISAQVARQWRAPDSNYLAFRGTCLTLSRDFARRVRLPAEVISDDAFLYLAARGYGYSPRSLDDVTIWYTLPMTIRDHVGQSARHKAAKHELRRYFSAKTVNAEYAVPRGLLMRLTAERAIRHPALIGTYLFLRLLLHLRYTGPAHHHWRPAASTKKRRALANTPSGSVPTSEVES